MYNLIFMGTNEFASNILNSLLNSPLYNNLYKIVLIITQPDRPIGRNRKIYISDIKEIALSNNIDIFQPEDINLHTQKIKLYNPHLIITASYGQFLKDEILNICEFNPINIHASLLPKYRGAAPIQKALLEGEKYTGITIMNMVKKMDAGDILFQKKIKIDDNDDFSLLIDKLKKLASDMIVDILPLIFEKKISKKRQNESLVTYAPIIKRIDRKIDWNDTAENINNKIRAYSYIGAYSFINNKELKIFKSKIIKKEDNNLINAGTIYDSDKNFCLVSTKTDYISLLEVQLEGRKKNKINEFMNGIGIKLLRKGMIF